MTEYRRQSDRPSRAGAQAGSARHASQPSGYAVNPSAYSRANYGNSARARMQQASADTSYGATYGAMDAYREAGAYRGGSGAYRMPEGPDGGKRRRRGGVARVVFIVSLIVFIVAVAALGTIVFSYWQGRSTYDKIAELGFQEPEYVADPDGLRLEDLTVDWDALKAVNPDIVGWIYVPNTNINYPVVQGENNSYYLTHDFQGTQGWLAVFGCIFLEATNSADFSDPNNVMYGHNMNDGSMFSDIAKLQDQEAFDASRTFYLLTPEGNYRLTSFSLVHCQADDPIVQTQFVDKASFTSYVQDKIDRSVVAADGILSATAMKKTFAFSTCDNLPTNGRLVLFSYVSESTVATDENDYTSTTEDDSVDQSVSDAIAGAAGEAVG